MAQAWREAWRRPVFVWRAAARAGGEVGAEARRERGGGGATDLLLPLGSVVLVVVVVVVRVCFIS